MLWTEKEMKRILAALGVTSLALLGASATAFATDESSEGGGEKITICHATGSETNPYVPITISVNALNAHMGHQHDQDIIPANNGKALPGGRNLDKLDWWDAGCGKPGGTPHEDYSKKITICHATGSETNPYVEITMALQGLNGHAGDHHQHSGDIIPPNDGAVIPWGQNWDDEGKATYGNSCVPAEEPYVVPPTDTPVVPPDTPVVPPADTPVVPPADTPVVPGAPAPAAPGGGAAAVVAHNEGFNVQTAVSGTDGPAAAPWIGGVAALLFAGAVVAARRTLPSGGSHNGQHRE
jgi:hypothetical protein